MTADAPALPSTADHQEHSPLGASKTDIWLNCAGSLALGQGIPDPPSTPNAEEGRTAHRMAERVLAAWKQGGHHLSVANDALGFELQTAPDREMVEHVRKYVLHGCVEQYLRFDKQPKAAQVRVEHRLVFDDDVQMFGTADFLATGTKTGVPCGLVVDLKYGKKKVVAEANPQLAFYAASLWKRSKLGLKSVRVVIFQPRVKNGVTIVDYDEAALRLWAHTLLAGAEKAVWQLLMNKPELNPGAHCWFCKVRPTCPALLEKRRRDAAKDFETVMTEEHEG